MANKLLWLQLGNARTLLFINVDLMSETQANIVKELVLLLV